MKENISVTDEENFTKYELSREITDAIDVKFGSIKNFLFEVESGKIDFFVEIYECISMLLKNNTHTVELHEPLYTTEMIVENLIKFISTANINNYKNYNIDFDLEGNTYKLSEIQKTMVSTFLKKCVHWLHELDCHIYIAYLYANLKIYINYNPSKYQYFFQVLEYIENHKDLELCVSQEGEILANIYCIKGFKIDIISWFLIDKNDWDKTKGIIINDDTKDKKMNPGDTRLFDAEIASKITETAKEVFKNNLYRGEVEIPVYSYDDTIEQDGEIKMTDEKRKDDEKQFFSMSQRAVYDAESTHKIHDELTLLSSGSATTANIDLKNMFSIYLHILKLAEVLLKKPDIESFKFPSDIRLQFAVMKPELLSYNFRFIHDWLTSENCKMDSNFRKAFCAAAYILFEVAEKEEFSKMLHDTALELGSFDYQLTTTIRMNKFKIRTIKEIVVDVNKGINKAISECEAYTRFRYACDYFAKTDSSGYKIEVNIHDGIVIKVPHLTISLNFLLSDFIKFDEEIGLLEVDVLKYNASYEKGSMFNTTIQSEILNEVEKLSAFCNVHIGMDKYHRSNIMAGSSGILVRDKDELIDITKLDYTSDEGLIADIKNYEIMIHRNLGILFKVLINLVAVMMKQHNSAQ